MRIHALVALAAMLTLLVAACDGDDSAISVPTITPAPGLVTTSTPTTAPVSASTPESTDAPAPTATPSPTRPVSAIDAPVKQVAAQLPDSGYLTEEIPPCTPVEGAPLDPCELDALQSNRTIAGFIPELGDAPSGMRHMLGVDRPSSAVHLVVRGTYLPNTVRCTSLDPFRPPNYAVDTSNLPENVPDSAVVDVLEGAHSIKCYIDMRVNAYLLGNGPSKLSVILYVLGYYAEDFATEGKTWQEAVEELRQSLEAGFASTSAGQEHVVFLMPSPDLSSLAWMIRTSWDVQRREDNTIVAVHPDRDLWRDTRPDDYPTHRSALEMTLPAITQAITTAHQTRMTEYEGRIGEDANLPMLVSNANQLRQFFTAARIPGLPDNPMPPPPPCGLVVENQAEHGGLMGDCTALLDSKDILRGTGTLNWSTGTAIASWDGVALEGTPQRITKLKLANKSLTGNIPERLTDLTALTEIKLAGNTLTGCIPAGLSSIAANDLSTLGLPGCQPPAPGNLRHGTAAERSIPLSWNAVQGVSQYRVRFSQSGWGQWISSGNTTSATSQTVERLACGRAHRFRVYALGNGTAYAANWSEPSAVVEASTTACVSPVFDQGSYAFSISHDTAVGAVVDIVSATNPDGETVLYSITDGNDDDAFAIVSTGAITVAGPLDHETTPAYELTVEASDGTNASTAQVTITVKKA